jgi:parvulin-like peptidyl-prolyl isomerase
MARPLLLSIAPPAIPAALCRQRLESGTEREVRGMRASKKDKRVRITWRKAVIGLGCAGVAVAGVVWGRQAMSTDATASPPTSTPTESGPSPATPPTVAPATEDWRQPVAYIHGNIAITREELANYLIARYSDRLEHLVDARIIEQACRERGITISEKDIDNALNEHLKDLKVNKVDFVQKVLKRYGKSLYEWREDVIRPNLSKARYCQDMVTASDDELKKAFDKAYGPKVHCQIIVWPKDKRDEAESAYERIRSEIEEFDHVARMQPDPDLAATAGFIAPFARDSMNEMELEDKAFSLKTDEISEPIPTKEAWILIKCRKQIPAQNVKLESVRAQLEQEIKARKMQDIIKAVFDDLKKKSNWKNLLAEDASANEKGDASRPVAYVWGVAITRQEFGDYLIARYGADRLQHLVNKRIIEMACRERGITVTEQDIDEDLKSLNQPAKQVEDYVRKNYGKSMYEWREDAVRPKLYMTRYCKDMVQAEDIAKDFDIAFEAYYGPKVHCQMILWPPDQKDIARKMYDQVRKGGAEFDRIAHTQANPTLAHDGGLMQPFGKRQMGNDELERVAFSLKPGEVSQLIDTPQGVVALKCVKQIPAPSDVNREEVRAQLEKEIRAQKIQALIPRVIDDMQKKAKPLVFLKNGYTDNDVRKQVENELQIETGKGNKITSPPQGN